jgi:hypothetical protein
MKKILIIIFAIILCASIFTGCRQSDVVSYNMSKEADNFDVTRKITVINARTDSIVFQLEGIFSLKNNSNNELTIICKTGENEYKKHFIYLNENTLYFVEDIGGADVSSISYKVNFFPQKIGNVVDFETEWVD